MRQRLILIALAVALLPVAACKKESDDAPAAVGAVLQSIAVDPASATVDVGAAAALTCLGTYSDGSQAAVAADWTSLDPAIASVPPGASAAVVVTGLSDGPATIQASFDGLTATATITVTPAGLPADPGPVYGCADTFGFAPIAGILEYPAQGGGPPTTLWMPTAFTAGKPASGFMLDSANAHLYVTAGFADDSTVYAYDLASGMESVLAPLGAGLPMGLDYDSQDRIYTQDYYSGSVRRIDPATGAVEVIGSTGGGMSDLVIGPNDVPYYCPIFSSTGAPWIVRHDLSTGSKAAWAVMPAAAVYASGLGVCAGLAMTSTGDAIITSMGSNQVFKYSDLNGDGDALDAGEEAVITTLPFTSMIDGGGRYIFGLGVAAGDTVLVNVEPDYEVDFVGIYWLVDRNGDGVADQADELVWYNEQWVQNGLDGGCIAAPRR